MPRPDDNVTFVEHSGLAGGNPEDGLVEPKTEAVAGRFDVGGDCGRSIPELGVATSRRASDARGPTTTVFVRGSLPRAKAGCPVETPRPRRWPGVKRQ
jgi:hypothetical protein